MLILIWLVKTKAQTPTRVFTFYVLQYSNSNKYNERRLFFKNKQFNNIGWWQSITIKVPHIPLIIDPDASLFITQMNELDCIWLDVMETQSEPCAHRLLLRTCYLITNWLSRFQFSVMCRKYCLVGRWSQVPLSSKEV